MGECQIQGLTVNLMGEGGKGTVTSDKQTSVLRTWPNFWRNL